MTDTTLVNGFMHDYTSIEHHAGGVTYPSVKDVSYSTEVDGKKVYGAAARQIGRTRGQVKDEFSFTMYKTAWEDFRKNRLGGAGFMEKIFTWVVTYGDGIANVTDTIQNARVTKAETSPSTGSEPIEVKVTCEVFRILWGGDDPVLGPTGLGPNIGP